MAFLALWAPANAETASARSTRGGAVPRGPKGTCLAAGSHGGARAGSWCTAPWWVSVHGCARAHVWRASPQCKVSGFAPGASRSFGASIGPLGTQRVDLGRRWPKTFLLCPRNEDFFKNGTVSGLWVTAYVLAILSGIPMISEGSRSVGVKPGRCVLMSP